MCNGNGSNDTNADTHIVITMHKFMMSMIIIITALIPKP